jgi:hypothetical protein
LFGYVDALFADVGCAPIDLDSYHG